MLTIGGETTPTDDHGRVTRRDNACRSPIGVFWSQSLRLPVAFFWRGRRHRIERVLETWVLETGWWRDDDHVSRSYWRVRAEGRVFDLCYDRIDRRWTLERALN